MKQYALHIGLFDYDVTDPKWTREVIEDLRSQVDDAIRTEALPIEDFEVHSEGDSFIEWGEPYLGSPFEDADSPHGMVYFDAPSHKAAWGFAIAIFRDLVTHPDPMLRLGATCDPSLGYSPMTVTSAEVWSSQITVTGEVKGDDFPA